MARPLRIEYAGAFHHVMARGNARQRIYRIDYVVEILKYQFTGLLLKYGASLTD